MNTHRIHRVAKLTGLSKDVIRVWERRYGLVKPSRSSNRYREYSDEEVALLRFVKAQMEEGTTIGALAGEGHDSLIARMRLARPISSEEQQPHERLLDELMGALDPLDKAGFERRLNGAVAVIPFEEAVQRVLLPLQCRVGERWHQGHLTIAVEHYVTKLIQQKMFSVMNQLSVNESGPCVLIGCPEGESHEIGAQAVAYIAATRGCHVYYLGPNLPSSDLLSFCDRIHPDLVLLSITETKSDADARRQIQELEIVSAHWPVAVGGQGARAMGELLRDTKIELLDDLTALQRRLMTLLLQHMLPSRG
ncbi:MAG: cobalamin B12-binding domain-containing protein [Nitrospiraceae bacterium]|jgi:DNA-binding transcriptional MerR regulator/methylmalonyl-CoA mutase cobalamin-binding subunit|nr:cobalamin B12-binding domain-containing protein [Nitrospiraceae bacterium]